MAEIKPLLWPVPAIAMKLSVSEVTARRLLRLGYLDTRYIGPRIFGTDESVARVAREGVPKDWRKHPCPTRAIEAVGNRKLRPAKKRSDTAREAGIEA